MKATAITLEDAMAQSLVAKQVVVKSDDRNRPCVTFDMSRDASSDCRRVWNKPLAMSVFEMFRRARTRLLLGDTSTEK